MTSNGGATHLPNLDLHVDNVLLARLNLFLELADLVVQHKLELLKLLVLFLQIVDAVLLVLDGLVTLLRATINIMLDDTKSHHHLNFLFGVGNILLQRFNVRVELALLSLHLFTNALLVLELVLKATSAIVTPS